MGLFSGNGFLSQLGNTALSFLPGVGGYMAGQEANQANAQQAQQQMGFQERMSNTAHQREVADLRAAGLNPILSANGGGSSTPQGAQAQMQPTDLSQVTTSAIDAYRTKAEVDSIKQKTNLDKLTGKVAVSQEKMNETSAKKLATDEKVAQAQEKILKAQLPGAAAKSRYDEKTYDIDSNWAPVDAIGKRVGAVVDTTARAIGQLKPNINIGKSKSQSWDEALRNTEINMGGNANNKD